VKEGGRDLTRVLLQQLSGTTEEYHLPKQEAGVQSRKRNEKKVRMGHWENSRRTVAEILNGKHLLVYLGTVT
jgi:hypothetical protein